MTMKLRTCYIRDIKNTISVLALCAIISIVSIINNKVISALLPIENKTIIIDAGHGGFDPGKKGTYGDDEKNINLEIATYLQQYLEQNGATVIITRGSDEALGNSKNEDMRQRKEITNESNGDILISIHQNSYTSNAAYGAQVFYYSESEKSQKLAENIQASLVETLDNENQRQAKSNSSYYILKSTNIPAAIVECGFLSNDTEEKKLNDSEYQQDIAWAIYKGILDYFYE